MESEDFKLLFGLGFSLSFKRISLRFEFFLHTGFKLVWRWWVGRFFEWKNNGIITLRGLEPSRDWVNSISLEQVRGISSESWNNSTIKLAKPSSFLLGVYRISDNFILFSILGFINAVFNVYLNEY